ncbi:MAG: ribosomal protein S18-alanine N-acetyltransferase [Candidatus Cloacimonetes bacterium]|jgi:ribosomal-protein-alanine N-acetyltransferase|nr:ribosomal protein S18-alanine N-acetyltransferase [Candidatus Cloacimonadota bacterium]MDD4156480.1 ribosomal protein S18-alanine N-acetyltransferase [Candidatus Cloacimonadota bacterium]
MDYIDKKTNHGIRKMKESDLTTVHKIEQDCFPEPWPMQAFKESLKYNESLILYDITTNEILAFQIGIGVLDEYSICNIAVNPVHQKKGLGKYFLTNIIEMHFKKYEKYFLEVRKSNKQAIALYHKLGFKVIYTRNRYYSNPIEDALVMMFSLSERRQ